MSEKEKWQKMDKAERLRHQLEVQSRQIERVFSSHQVSARVAGGQVATQSIRFDLHSHLESGKHKLIGLKNDLLAALGVSEVSLKKDETGHWRLDIMRPHEPPVALLDLMPLLSDLPENTAVLGLDEEGSPLLLSFSDPDVSHIFVTGAKGSGKTSLLRTFAVSLAMGNRQSKLQLLVIDPDRLGSQNRQLSPLMLLPHLLSHVISDPDEASYTLKTLVEEMYHRLKSGTVFPTIATLIDNVDALIEVEDDDVQSALVELLQRGGEAGINLILSSENPRAEWLNRSTQANLPIRLVGEVRSEEDSQAATGSPDAEAEYLLGSGDFLAVSDGVHLHFQAAYIDNYDLHLTLDTIHRNRPQPLLAQPLLSHTEEMSAAEGPDLIWERSKNAPASIEVVPLENIVAEDDQDMQEE